MLSNFFGCEYFFPLPIKVMLKTANDTKNYFYLFYKIKDFKCYSLFTDKKIMIPGFLTVAQ